MSHLINFSKTSLVCLLGLFFAASALAQNQSFEYGVGLKAAVPYVESGAITLDGVGDEAAWAGAQVINPNAYWDGAWSGHPDPDVVAEGRLLYSEGMLYVYVEVADYDVWIDPDNPGGSDQILLGVDLVHTPGQTDVQTDDGFAGFVDNAPDLGPVTYKISPGVGITLNWGGEGGANPDPVAEGWVQGATFFDETTLVWGVELAIVNPAITSGAEVGFNLGLGSAKEEGIDDRGEATYAFSSWQVCNPDLLEDELWCGAGGTVMSDAHSFASLSLVTTGPTAVEPLPDREIPGRFVLQQNYPNPFNPVTTIEYGVPRTGQVTLAVYNTLGQQVAMLVEGEQSAGQYRVDWQAVDMPSGLYLYRLQVNGAVVATRKMMLVK